jgi:thiol-disulfide isomerase/thioredoxin
MVTYAKGLGKRDKEKYFDHIARLGLNDDYAAINNYAYASIVDRYVDFRFNGGVYPMGVVDHLEFIRDGKAVTGLTLQSCLARELSGITSSSKWDTLYSKFLSSITDKRLLAYVNQARNSYLVSIGAVKSAEYIHPDLTLSAIFSKYKGKVLYVDFWASWCGPCKNEMPNAAALKEKFAGKEVVFIYLGYKDKTDNWLAARKDLEIEGEHYLLDDKQIKEAEELFEINGIPHYVIIDKEGRILAKHADRPAQVYERLLKLL